MNWQTRQLLQPAAGLLYTWVSFNGLKLIFFTTDLKTEQEPLLGLSDTVPLSTHKENLNVLGNVKICVGHLSQEIVLPPSEKPSNSWRSIPPAFTSVTFGGFQAIL